MRLSSRTIYCIQCTSICIRKIVHKGTLYSLTWLPYVQKILYSEGPMFRGSYVQKIFVQKVLCLDGLIFRRYYVQKVLCSEKFVQKVLYSEGPICSEDPIFRNICLESSISRRSYVQRALYSEDPLFRRSYAGTHFHLSASGIKTSRVSFFIPFINLLFTSSRDTRE